LGYKIKDFEQLTLDQLVRSPWYSDGMTRYFRISDVEGLEKAHDLKPNEGQICDDDKIGNPEILDGDIIINDNKCLDVLHEKHKIEKDTEKRLELESYIKVAEEFLKKDSAGS
jgi:hypothetical protein